MKKIYTLLFGLLISINLFSQAPQKMSYQTIIRDASNKLVSNQSIGVRISILQASNTGIEVYEEIYNPNPKTNINGLLTLEIGTGLVLKGTFASINWASGPYFIKTETDPSGGTNYSIIGVSELLSVPYALYSGNVSSSTWSLSSVSLNSNGTISVNGTLGSGGPVSSTTSAWTTSGNTGINPKLNYIGTSDNNDVVFKRNNEESGRIAQFNTAFGNNALKLNSSANNTAFGAYALTSNTLGSDNTAIGTFALTSNTIGSDNTSTGWYSLYRNISGSNNTANGSFALSGNTDGNDNSAYGNRTLAINSSGSFNVASGSNALKNNTIGSNNVANGANSLFSNSSGNYNTASGFSALYTNTTGSNNSAFGVNSLYSNTSGTFNTSFGAENLKSNTSGNRNTVIGNTSLNLNKTGNNNIAVGSSVLFNNVSGDENSALGYAAMANNNSGSFNTGIGSLSLYNSTTGLLNTAVGYRALYDLTSGTNNIGIGYNAQVPTATANNQIRIGNTGITYAGVQVAWSITSDKRWKSDIKKSELGLEFIKKLNPVSYLRNNDNDHKTEYGFIAQEVEESLNNSGAVNNGIITKDDNGLYNMRYNDLLAPMVKAIQEQQNTIQKLLERIEILEKEKLINNK